ncbi:MAG: Fe-S cluster assembly sulfur transfer protein SufU [bacterium]
MDDLKEIYNEVIVEHYKNPFNKKILEEYNFEEEGVNPSCGDQIKLFVLIKDEKIKDISFEGQGCSISIASSSILTSTIKELSISQAQKITEKATEYIKTGKIQDKNFQEYEIFKESDIMAFSSIHNFPVRIKCALLPWITLKSILEKIQIKQK